MYSQQAVEPMLRPSNEGVIQTSLRCDVVRTGSWLVRDAGGNRTHFNCFAGSRPAIWLQRQCARRERRVDLGGGAPPLVNESKA